MTLVSTATKHIALDVAYDHTAPFAEPKGNKEEPQVTAEDLIVYYLGEGELPLLHELSFCIGLGKRGVSKGDRLGQLSERRARELQKQAAEDKRSWAALRRQLHFGGTVVHAGFSEHGSLRALRRPMFRDRLGHPPSSAGPAAGPCHKTVVISWPRSQRARPGKL